MKQEPLLSIIIPCYNSAPFIERTIQMLLAQDLNHCEVIFVNDGSLDDTPVLLSKYKDHPSFKIVTQRNQGVSVARNVGIAQAEGIYVYFLDSDDFLFPETLAYFKHVIAQHSTCDFFVFGYDSYRNGQSLKRYVYPSYHEQTFHGTEFLSLFFNKQICLNICSSICKRELLLTHSISFVEGMKIGEDVLFLMQVLFRSAQVYYSSRLCFRYLIRDDSAMQGYQTFTLNRYHCLRVWKDFMYQQLDEGSQLRKDANFFLYYTYFSFLCFYFSSNQRNLEIERLFLQDSDLKYQPISSEKITYYLVLKFIRWIPVSWFFKLQKWLHCD